MPLWSPQLDAAQQQQPVAAGGAPQVQVHDFRFLEQLGLTREEEHRLDAMLEEERQKLRDVYRRRYAGLGQPQPAASLRNGSRIPLVGLGTW